jgi:hypothetical protein
MAYRQRKRTYRKKPQTTYGKLFTTKRGRRGKYKYVNGRRVGFKATRKSYRR